MVSDRRISLIELLSTKVGFFPFFWGGGGGRKIVYIHWTSGQRFTKELTTSYQINECLKITN